MESRRSVILSKYDPNIKKHVEYPSLVIGERTLDDHKQPVYALVHFRHDDLAAHHALSGVDWADTIERVLDVPHKSDLGNQSFYWQEVVCQKCAESTEGRDEALQAIADENARKPSAEDLDAVAADQDAATKTSKPKKIAFGKS